MIARALTNPSTASMSRAAARSTRAAFLRQPQAWDSCWTPCSSSTAIWRSLLPHQSLFAAQRNRPRHWVETAHLPNRDENLSEKFMSAPSAVP